MNTSADDFFGTKRQKPQPIIGDRSTVEQYATCPQQAHLCLEHQIDVNAKLADTGNIVHDLIREAFVAICGCPECQGDGKIDGKICGTCRGTGFTHFDAVAIADYFTNELPKTRPDLQPEALRAAKFVGDEIQHLNATSILMCERQIDWPPRNEDGTVDNPPLVTMAGIPLVLTTKPDLVMAGSNNSLIIYDWKSGWKRRTNGEAYEAFQTQFITWILWQMFKDVKLCHFWYKETRFGTAAYARLEREEEVCKDLTTEDAFKSRIVQAANYWLAGSKDAWPEQTKCAQCRAIKYCVYATTEAKDLAADPKAWVDHLCVLEALVDQYYTTGTAWTKDNGAIEGTETTFEFVPPDQKYMPKIHKKDSKTTKTRKKK